VAVLFDFIIWFSKIHVGEGAIGERRQTPELELGARS